MNVLQLKEDENWLINLKQIVRIIPCGLNTKAFMSNGEVYIIPSLYENMQKAMLRNTFLTGGLMVYP